MIRPLCLGAVLLPAWTALAQQGQPANKPLPLADPIYPKINLAVPYEVDPAWPKKPADFAFGHCPGVAVDKADRIWVFTRSKAPTPPVQCWSTDGSLIRAWGADTVKTAHHIKIDREGNVWLADIGHHVVRKYTAEGRLLLTLGTEGEPGCDRVRLNKPTDMAIAPDGDVFVSDGYGNNRIVRFDRNGKFVKEWGKLGTGPGEFSIPHAIAIDSRGRLYVADRNNVRIQVFDRDGKFLDEWRHVVTPWGFCMTERDELWVCGSSPMPWRPGENALGCPPKDQLFMRFNTEGRLLQLWTVPKGEDGKEKPGELNWVHGLAVDSAGNLYAGDIVGCRVQKFVKK
jgi:hypothetical protein